MMQPQPVEHAVQHAVEVPAAVAVVLTMITALVASAFAWRFSRRIGGEMGAAFRFVVFGVIVFALTRIEDAFKTTGLVESMGLDYKATFWIPHHLFVLVGWSFITIGFYKMTKAFSV
jgi:hypothetical protein